MIKKVEVKVFPSYANSEACERYIDGHKKVLEAYGVSQVTSANYEWKNRKSTYLITVEDLETKRLLGGARVQVAERDSHLPLEDAINDLDPKIYTFVRERLCKGTAEFCGLWNSREATGYGIGTGVLGRVGVAILPQLKLGSLFVLCSPATVKYSRKVGLTVIRTLGINGTFYYPKEDLLATAMLIDDPLTIKDANPEDREMIFDLREHPVQRRLEEGPKGTLDTLYDLNIQE